MTYSQTKTESQTIAWITNGVFYWLSLHLFNCKPGVCLLQPGPGIGCSGLWTSASTTWRSPILSCLMTLCTSVRPRRPPCAPGGPNSMYSVSELATDTGAIFLVLFSYFTHHTPTVVWAKDLFIPRIEKRYNYQIKECQVDNFVLVQVSWVKRMSFTLSVVKRTSSVWDAHVFISRPGSTGSILLTIFDASFLQ